MTYHPPITCEHDGDAGVLRSGEPRCPMCRLKRQTRTAPRTTVVDVAALVAHDPDLLDGLT